MTFLQKLLCAFVFCFMSLNAFGGGEVPWPLAVQRSLSEQSAKGTWYVKIEERRFLYNIEIIRRSEIWIWVRVSVLHLRTMEVLSQGEGYFWDAQGIVAGQEEGDPDEVEGLPVNDPGSYVFMRPVSGDQPGFFIRLVQLEDRGRTTLGVSVFENLDPDLPTNARAHQVGKNPLTCPGTSSDSQGDYDAEEDIEPSQADVSCTLETADVSWPWHVPDPGLEELEPGTEEN